MTYQRSSEVIVPDRFKEMITIMYVRCGKKATTEQIMRWYCDFGKYPEEIMIKACKYIRDNGSTYAITWKVIKDAISEVTPKREETGTVGCTYCDTLGCIDYWKEINNVRYQFSARCHKCRTSRYTNLPYYNEVFPNDDIKPHSTPEQMVCGKHIVQDVVKLVTKREHEDYDVERKRKQTMWGEGDK